jgi:hypothetical protein
VQVIFSNLLKKFFFCGQKMNIRPSKPSKTFSASVTFFARSKRVYGAIRTSKRQIWGGMVRKFDLKNPKVGKTGFARLLRESPADFIILKKTPEKDEIIRLTGDETTLQNMES